MILILSGHVVWFMSKSYKSKLVVVIQRVYYEVCQYSYYTVPYRRALPPIHPTFENSEDQILYN